jgi:hypothetical protein
MSIFLGMFSVIGTRDLRRAFTVCSKPLGSARNYAPDYLREANLQPDINLQTNQ